MQVDYAKLRVMLGESIDKIRNFISKDFVEGHSSNTVRRYLTDEFRSVESLMLGVLSEEDEPGDRALMKEVLMACNSVKQNRITNKLTVVEYVDLCYKALKVLEVYYGDV